MQPVIAPEQDSNVLQRQKRVYFPVILVTSVMLLLVFMEPTLRRVVAGLWQRGKFRYAWSLSLDFHAILAYGFLFLVVLQVWYGFTSQTKPQRLSFHRSAGQWMFRIMIPLFILGTTWVVYDRSTNIAPAASVIFKKSRFGIRMVLFLLIVVLSYTFAKAWWAIRKKDVQQHIDSILYAFLIAAGVGILRFFYLLFWAIRGGSPFSLMGMYFLTALFVFLLLVCCFAATGRLRQNRWDLLLFFAANLALAVALRGHYTFLDV